MGDQYSLQHTLLININITTLVFYETADDWIAIIFYVSVEDSIASQAWEANITVGTICKHDYKAGRVIRIAWADRGLTPQSIELVLQAPLYTGSVLVTLYSTKVTLQSVDSQRTLK